MPASWDFWYPPGGGPGPSYRVAARPSLCPWQEESMMRIAVAGAVVWLGLLGLVSGARADEEKITLKDVPRAVLDAVKEKFPGAELTGAEKETEDGKTTNEVALQENGKNVDVALTAEGKIVEIERE